MLSQPPEKLDFRDQIREKTEEITGIESERVVNISDTAHSEQKC